MAGEQRQAAGPASLWEATACAGAAWPALAGEARAQVTVVGGGYTGLSAALHLAEAGIDTVLVDSHAPGWGASGRNGGQVIAGLKHDPDDLERLFGAAGAAMLATAAAAPDLVFDLIARHGIDCEATRTGWLQLAVSGATLAAVGERARQWRTRGVKMRDLARAEAAQLSGSSLYLGGSLDPRGGTVQPLSYARGLARAAEAAGARLFAGSPVVRLESCGDGWRVHIPGGSVAAGQVILATNAYADQLHDGLRRSVVAVPSFQIASEPLPADLRRMILPERQSVSDTRRLLRYFRTDAAGRLVMGARGRYGAATPSIRHHLAAVREIFPQAAGLDFPYRWGGMVAMTPDHLPHLHRLAPGLLAGLGYNGRGVAMATAMGRALAALATGGDPGFPVTQLRPLRLHRFSRLGVHATVQLMRLRDSLST